MKNKTIELKIERLAGLADGMGISEGRKVFVPYSSEGDLLTVEIIKTTADADYGKIIEIIKPGTGRIKPECKHFGACGGCSMQHISKMEYLDFKQKTADLAISKAGFNIKAEKIVTIPQNSRRRATFKLENGKVGFYEEGSHNIVDMEECLILDPELFNFIKDIKPSLISLPEITKMQVNKVANGYDLVLECRNLTQEKIQKAGLYKNELIRRISFRIKDKIQIIHTKGKITIAVSGVQVPLPPQAFLQASVFAENKMINLVTDSVKNSKNILDLFSGIGTYSINLAKFSKVTAIEIDAEMVKALQSVNVNNLTVTRRDLFAKPLDKKELSVYDAIVINPPRTGAKAQCELISLSSVPKVTMVSCNPATFSRDARILKQGGYNLKKVTPIDQFVYSSHLELVAEFDK
ncbi:MAG: methyltransferase [Pseudomonadota bacterium]